MKIVAEYPPNYKQIEETFNLSGRKPVFAYGDTIYNPHDIELPDHLIVHESVHGRQHSEMVGGADMWWERYLADPEFRLIQEIEAFGAQYKCIRSMYGRRIADSMLFQLADLLSSPMYGGVISHGEAESKIRNQAKLLDS